MGRADKYAAGDDGTQGGGSANAFWLIERSHTMIDTWLLGSLELFAERQRLATAADWTRGAH